MGRFNRNYKLKVQQRSQGLSIASGFGFVNVSLPFTLEFDITRKILSGSSNASFKVYNLNEDSRNKMRRDQYDFADFREVSLDAGYGTDNLATLFKGTIQQAWSVRQGTEYLTQIDCSGAAFAIVNSTTSQTYSKGTPQDLILKNLIGKLPNISEGAIGPSFRGQVLTARGNTLEGSTTEVLSQITGGGFFIDNGKAYVLADNEAILGDIVIIDSASGLLSTPILEQNFLHFDMLFEPRLLIGQVVQLQSITAKNFNGTYKVISLQHKGTISTSVCGDAITTVGLATGFKDLTVVPSV